MSSSNHQSPNHHTSHPSELPLFTARHWVMLLSLLSMNAYCALKLVKLRSTLVELAYENQVADRRFKQASERLKRLGNARDELLVPHQLEGLAGRHGYRSAEAGQIIVLDSPTHVAEGDERLDDER